MVSVFVTGASGFIAQHIVKLLVEKKYKVVGTVRSAAKGEKLQESLGADNFQYEIVPDIQVEGAFDEAIKNHPEVTVAMHTASPFTYDITDPEKDLILPALEGTRQALTSIKKYGPQITRVVVTSSDAAVYSAEDEQKKGLYFDESSWNNISREEAIKDPVSAYYGAKAFAEKLSWEIAKETGVNFTLSTVNPVYVFGPQAFISEVKEQLNVSNELIHHLIKVGPEGKFDNDKGGFIDVRDVALAHVAAFEREDTKNKRLFMTNGHFSTQAMLDIINKNFDELKGKIPVGTPGSGPEDISTLATVNNEKTKALLGFEFRSLDTIVIDTVKQILDVRKSKI
ncbi:putative NADPH-dependent methylglyoxal reductase Grp2p [[Candida] anglica]|uniref:NADPH-dependent methylglyoxal reductase Grp2p n=1 Tax=[Candida] anglica TaxID=148631 RepID=A0ABP0E5U3_9ASCO